MLQMPSDQMRSLGYKVVDMIVDHYATLAEKRVTCIGDRDHLESLLREPLPASATDPLDVLRLVESAVLAHIMHVDHPRFFAFVPGPSNFIGVLADAIASGHNVFSGTWFSGSGAAQVELVVIDWLRQLCGFGASAGGLLTSGGAVANLIALAVAREAARQQRPTDQAVVYCSDQTHYTVARGLRLLGLRSEQLCTIATGTDCRLHVSALADAVARDRLAGKHALAVVANAGTVNTGAVDPMEELAAFCRKEGIWLHADAAFGGGAVLCNKGRHLLRGLEQVDSVTIDPHKWLFQPYGIGCVLVRESSWLERTFRHVPEYLEAAREGAGEVNFCNRGIELTRPFRALKLWMTMKVFGVEQLAAAVEHGFALAETAERQLRDRQHWIIVTPAQMGVVTCRFVPEGLGAEEACRLNRRVADRVADEGFALVGTTKVQSQTVCRLCTINPRTRADDICKTVAAMDRAGRALCANR